VTTVLTPPCSADLGALPGGRPGNGTPKPRRSGRWATVALALTAVGAGALLLSTGGATTAQQTSPAGWEATAVAHALGLPILDVHVTGWRMIDTATGQRYDADVAGVGIVQLDATTKGLAEVIYDSRLGGSAGPEISSSQAVGTARAFAAGHADAFTSLTARPVEHMDHGAFEEYRFIWQARTANAWLPTQVTVGVNSRSGAVAYFATERVPVETPPAARINANQAAALALAVAGPVHQTVKATPELHVTVMAGRQQLVWVVPITTSDKAPHLSRAQIVWVDAVTGVARTVAAG